MSVINNNYSCPKCNEKLQINETFAKCSRCNSSYSNKDSILDLGRPKHNQFSEAYIDDLIKNLNQTNWSETIQKYISYIGKESPSGWLENLVIDGRYAWKLFLDLNKETTLLEINSGMGNLISSIENHVAKTIALDLDYQKLEFTKKRISIRSNSNNVEYVAMEEVRQLPFTENSVDCIIISDFMSILNQNYSVTDNSNMTKVINFIMNLFGDKNPKKIQLEFLKEVKRVLKNDGQLFIGTENRLNYENILGYTDNKSQRLKYSSLMPRFLAGILSILKNNNPYSHYIYSLYGYKNLLKKAGFEYTEFLGFTTGYTFLDQIHATDINCPIWQPNSDTNLKNTIKFSRFFIPEYGIIASENTQIRSRLQDKIFEKIQTTLGNGNDQLVIKSYLVTGKGKLVLKGKLQEKRLIIKVPLNETAVLAESQNEVLIRRMSGNSATPEHYCKIFIDEFTCFVEEEVEGIEYQKSATENIYPSLLTALQTINPKDSLNHINRFSANEYSELVEKQLRLLTDRLEDNDLYHFLHQYFKQNLFGKKVTLGISHGDCSVSNVFTTDSGCRIIDWEAGYQLGLPIMDAINFVGSDYRFRNKKPDVLEPIINLTVNIDKTAEWWKFLEHQYNYYEMDSSLHVPLVYLNWLHAINCVYPHKLQYDKSVLDKFVYRIVRHLEKKL